MERKKADWLGTLGSKEQGSEFPWLYFCLTYPRLGAGEVGDTKMPTGKDTKSPKKILENLCPDKEPEKGET